MAPALLCDDDVGAHSSSKIKACQTALTPTIARLDFQAYEEEEALIADIARSLKVSGGCIVRGMYQQNTLDAMEYEIRPHIEAIKQADRKRDEFVPSSTRMVSGLLSKSRIYALSVAGNGLWHRVCEHFLTSRLTNSWVSE